QRDRLRGGAQLGSPVALFYRVHAKSSGKWVSALSTGSGVSPPIAHSEPWVMVSHRSRNSSRFAFGFSPARTRSITSTPRVEPIRHGVHFPHDSIAQNSIA